MRPALLLAALAAAPPAFALDCDPLPTTLPRDGATDVPTNVVLRLSADAEDDALHLFDAESGDAIATTRAPSPHAGDGEMLVLTPDVALDPNRSYALGIGDTLDAIGTPLVTFTTGSSDDTEAPAAPDIVAAERDAGVDEWGPWRFNRLTVDEDEPVAYLIELASDDTFTDSRFVELSPEGPDPTNPVLVLAGSGPCGGAIDLEEPERHMRVQAIDMAGNLGEAAYAFADGEEPEISDELMPMAANGCGCSASPLQASTVLLLIPLTLIGRRRRGASR